MATCIHGLDSRTCAFCRQVQMTPPPAMNEPEAVLDRHKRIRAARLAREQECPDCPHGYLVHGARGCWKCGCLVSWSELVYDGVRSERFPGAKR